MINKASWRIYTFLKLHSVKTREEENRSDFIMDVILKTGLEKMGSLCGLAEIGEMEREEYFNWRDQDEKNTQDDRLGPTSQKAASSMPDT